MKKLAAVMLVVAAVLSVSCAFASDGEKMTVEDVKLGTEYKIKGYAVVTFNEASFVDVIVQYNGYQNIKSGNEADYAYLRFDMRNLSKKQASFLGNMNVKVIYDDEYDYNGFVGQFDYNHSDKESVPYEIPLDPMYTGHYFASCTLPNFVVQDKNSPLRMIITINGHEFTYHIRK